MAGCASGKKADLNEALASARLSANPTPSPAAPVAPSTDMASMSGNAPPMLGNAPSAGTSPSAGPSSTAGPNAGSNGSAGSGGDRPASPSISVAPPPAEDTRGGGAEQPEATPEPALPPAEPEPPARDRELCRLEGNEVGIIGDSYIDITTFVPQLEALAREAGALGPTDNYVDHAVLGASMDGVPSIPDQWPEALADARRRGAEKIRLVIMDGGGNDVLLENRQCLGFPSEAFVSQPCKDVVTRALARGEELFEQMASDGVEAMIYFFYPHLPAVSLFGGPSPNTMVDYALPFVKEQCESQTAFDCHFVDLRPGFDDGFGNGRADLIGLDGVHPNDAGAAIMADAVWAVMQAECLGAE